MKSEIKTLSSDNNSVKPSLTDFQLRTVFLQSLGFEFDQSLLRLVELLNSPTLTSPLSAPDQAIDYEDEDDDDEMESGQPVYRPENLPARGMVVGLSLSFCVLDIAKGLVPYNRISEIIASTNFDPHNSTEVAEIKNSYGETYWNGELKSTCLTILDRLIADNKLRQPRREGKPITHIARGRWLLKQDMRHNEDYPKMMF